jgi:hypothetical protein
MRVWTPQDLALGRCGVTSEPILFQRADGYQILEALDHAAELAETVRSYSTQIEIEDAYGLVRDQIFPDLPDL